MAETRPRFKVVPVPIAQYPGINYTRYFVEVFIEGQWRETDNYETSDQAYRFGNRVVVVGNAWMDPEG